MKTLPILTYLLLSSLLCWHACAQSQSEDSVSEASRLLSNYLQHASVTGNEQGAGRFLSDICQRKGLTVEVFSDEADSYNFAASLYPLTEGKPNIILLNHIDVVPGGNESAWQHPAFSGAIAEGAVWGRGAIDMKGMAIMQLMALINFLPQSQVESLPYNVTILCVSEEEGVGGLGAERVIAEHFEELNPVVVFGEGGAGLDGLVKSNPSQLVFAISTTDKQALWLKVDVKVATSGHGSVPPPSYANQLMVKGLSRLLKQKSKIEINEANKPMFTALADLEKGAMKVVLKNMSWMSPIVASTLRKDPKILATVSNTITVTNLANETSAINQIAQEVSASLDCRLMPGTDREKFLNQIRKSFRDVPHSISVELETTNAMPSSVTNAFFSDFSNSLKEVYPGARIVPILFPAFTDNNLFRSHDVPVYGVNPVFLSLDLLESVHNVNERLPIESLELGIQVYTVFLNRVLFPQYPISRANQNRRNTSRNN